MANGIRWALLLLCFSMLCACTTPADRVDTEQTPSQHQTPVLHEQTQALEKAKNLSRTLRKTEDDRQRQFEGRPGNTHTSPQ